MSHKKWTRRGEAKKRLRALQKEQAEERRQRVHLERLQFYREHELRDGIALKRAEARAGRIEAAKLGWPFFSLPPREIKSDEPTKSEI